MDKGVANNNFVVRVQYHLQDLGETIRVDGVAGPLTVAAWERHFSAHAPVDQPTMPQDFRGDLGWIHEREGHRGKPYWPGGASGVTLDPGLDLGHADRTLIYRALIEMVPDPVERLAAQLVSGRFGLDAESDLARDQMLRSIRIPREAARKALPLIAKPYWVEILSRFPALTTAPPEVQTAMLSLAFNRGALNRHLEVLADPIQKGDYFRVGKLIKGMQQQHSLKGIRSRRRLEGQLILDAVERSST